ncbi:intelectin-1 isoform X1 [Danio aesculapii]|uniref:intelectin-1 isoform X1 n=1 Tax=Danio aesculapii TaxID=1142201 RepID=UPI0024BFCF65|nr:intelectin-1 isoform X1 [Danio aesculapii]
MQSAGFLLLCVPLISLLCESIMSLPTGKTPTQEFPESVTARSCRELLKKYGQKKDGLYYLRSKDNEVYQTYCDMSTSGGGWTLVASVHENNIHGSCTVGDRWTSQQGSSSYHPAGDESWSNKVLFGTAEAATNDDYKNPGYYDIKGKDIAVWHVHNDNELEFWKVASVLRYHTNSNFLTPFGGNLYHFFKKYHLQYGVGTCNDRGISVPIVYDIGSDMRIKELYGESVRSDFDTGYVTFRVFNNYQESYAMCSGVRPKGCYAEYYCIGGGGYFPNTFCSDFAYLGANNGATNGYGASKEIINAAVFIFYR